ncbi:MAG: hypothetical protein AAFY42_12620 [Pseudomonadota bacterium]
MSKVDGLSYSAGDVADVHLSNVERLVSKDPEERAVAKLNQELINLLDRWMDTQDFDRLDGPTALQASAHAVTTVGGTILLNLPPDARQEAFKVMRTALLAQVDAMAKAVNAEG